MQAEHMAKRLVLTENFPPYSGGSGRWFWELYSRLPREDYLVVADSAEGTAEFDQSHSLNIIRLPLQSPEWGLKSLTGIGYYSRVVWQLRKIIKQHGITEIHCGRVIPEGVIAWVLSHLCKVSYLCYVHGEDVETAATSREHHLLVHQVCKRADKIICNSHNSQSIVERLGYATSEKIEVLHPGVDTQRFLPEAPDNEFRTRMGWHNRQVMLTVGRLQRRKGQDFMIQAMVEIAKQQPDALYCIIGGGELEEELHMLIKQLKLTEHVQMLSEIDDATMIQCYQQCDLFILPNRTIDHDVEGFGMVLVEAQACGKPVIAGDSGGTQETLQPEKTGHIINCQSPEQITKQLLPLLQHYKQHPHDPEISRRWAVNTFDWQQHVEKAMQIFTRTAHNQTTG